MQVTQGAAGACPRPLLFPVGASAMERRARRVLMCHWRPLPTSRFYVPLVACPPVKNVSGRNMLRLLAIASCRRTCEAGVRRRSTSADHPTAAPLVRCSLGEGVCAVLYCPTLRCRSRPIGTPARQRASLSSPNAPRATGPRYRTPAPLQPPFRGAPWRRWSLHSACSRRSRNDTCRGQSRFP